MFETLRAYPRAFKVLMASALIENMAFGMIIPYLTIYMTEDIQISDALAGVVLAGYMLAGIPAMIFGGYLVDKIGRRTVLLTSLGLMAITTLTYSFTSSFVTLMVVALADSFVGSLYMPAASAMIADVIPSGERPHAYSIQRIAWNVGLIFGPMIGAVLVAGYEISTLFIFGSVILAGAFVMNLFFIPETKPKETGEAVTFKKVLNVAQDRPFLLITALSGAFWFFSTQFMSVLPVYATRGEGGGLGLPESTAGILWGINGTMIVLFQLWVTSKMVRLKRSLVLTIGQIVAATGLGAIFFAEDLLGLIACIVVMTIGELVYMSVLSAVIADMAPEDKRGIYMGFAGFVQTLGWGCGLFTGMWLLGLLGTSGAYVWAFFGIIGVSASFGYLVFAKMVGPRINCPHDASVEHPTDLIRVH